jgi:hypothetical protein
MEHTANTQKETTGKERDQTKRKKDGKKSSTSRGSNEREASQTTKRPYFWFKES